MPADVVSRIYNLPESNVDYFSDDDGSIHELDIERFAAAGVWTLECADETVFGVISSADTAAYSLLAPDAAERRWCAWRMPPGAGW